MVDRQARFANATCYPDQSQCSLPTTVVLEMKKKEQKTGYNEFGVVHEYPVCVFRTTSFHIAAAATHHRCT